MLSGAELHIHRLPGMQVHGDFWIELHLDHEDQLGAALLAVNDGGRILRLRRDEAHPPRQRSAHAIHAHLHLVADVNRADLRLRHEGAYLDLLWWQQRDDRVARRNPFAFIIKRVEDEAGFRRGLRFLVQVPLSFCKGGFAGAGAGFGGGDLIDTGAQVSVKRF